MIRFEWDNAKARTNRRKHGITFEIARHVFEDPDALVEQDRIEGGELRWQTIGIVDDLLMLLVAHTVEFGDDERDETIRIISAGGPTGRRESAMKKSVKRTTLSPLTAKQRRQVAALASLPDAKIDYSDIPALKDRFWKHAVRNPFYRPVKRQLTVRLDADVIAWLREQGKGYQTRINALLRAAMMSDVNG